MNYSCDEEGMAAEEAAGLADMEAEAYAQQCEAEAEQDNIEQNNTNTQQIKAKIMHSKSYMSGLLHGMLLAWLPILIIERCA